MSKLKVDEIRQSTRSVSDSANITLANDGTLSTGNLKIPDGGTIGSASDADAISISSAGYVIDSARPHFVVDGGGAGNHQANAQNRIPFNNEVRDHGGNFDTSNYFFLTPVAGVYIFHTQIYAYSAGSHDYSFEIRSNNTSDGDTLVLGRIHAYSVGQGQLLKTFGINYVPASRRISVVNSRSDSRYVYMGTQSHTVFHGCLIG